MKITPLKTTLLNLNTDLLVLVVKKEDLLPQKAQKKEKISFSALDLELSSQLSKNLKLAEFKSERGSSFFFTLQHPQISNLLIFSFEDEPTDPYGIHNLYRSLGSSISKVSKQYGIKKVAISRTNLKLEKASFFHALIEGIKLTNYQYSEYKSKKPTFFLEPEISLIGEKTVDSKEIEKALSLCSSTELARDLINMPPNDCTPPYLVEVSKQIAKKGKLQLEVLDRAKLEKLGAHSLLSVSKGSSLPPYLIKLTYKPLKSTSKTKVISIVGKGITFDTGGYSIKPADGMVGMKCDMAGAACVLGVMQAVADLKPNCEVRGYIPTTENMINGEATRVGDVVKAMNGKTIEILNTDAEGRLILADALVLACKEKANIVIDIATLTGACMVALGTQYAGLFTDDKDLSDSIIDNGEIEGERYWKLPLAPEYEEHIKSKIADIKNVGNGRWAGATTAALFLKEFVQDTRWAHLDIAGPADTDSDKGFLTTGGVGFSVRTLTRFILSQK